MPKNIAIVAYNTKYLSTQAQDVLAIQTVLQTHGNDALLVHQWSLDRFNAAHLIRARIGSALTE